MVTRKPVAVLPAALILALAAASGTAVAAPRASFHYLFDIDRVSNDSQLFLNLTVARYGPERPVLEPLLPRLRNLEDDLPVALFLAHRSYTPLADVVALRARGFSWSVIFTKVEVPVAVLFRGIKEDPGPPYGKAWGYWRKNPKSVRLSDAEIAGLVQVQIGSRWARMSALEMARSRGQGKKVPAMVAARKGRPWQAARAEHAGGPGKGRPKGKPGTAAER
jgi:hypothetical protein